MDDPTLPQGYGSFTWDDEGVKADRKTLLESSGVVLLHTRLTAGEQGKPRNAHGVVHKPRPMTSNVYIKPADWTLDEMLQDTRNGVYARGLVRAECDTSDGAFELNPEISYLLEQGKIGEPVKHLRIVGNIVDLVQRVDAVGREASMRPNMEKGFSTSEGGPHIRIDGAPCF